MSTRIAQWLTCLAFLFVLDGCASPEPAVDAPASESSGGEETTEVERGPSPTLLYRVTHGERVSYLFGTVHVAVTLSRALPAPHDRALTDAREVVAEADAAAMDPQVALRAGTLPEGQQLSSMLSRPAWEGLVEAVGPAVPAAALDRMRPWLASAVYLIAWIQRNMQEALAEGALATEPMDQQIIRDARERGQQVSFVETAEDQLAAVASLPDGVFAEDLEEMILEPTETEATLRGLFEAYLAGDEAAIAETSFDPDLTEAAPDFLEVMFHRRNRAWIQTLGPRLRSEGGLFIAVGAGHLLGDQGLVALLRREGFEVTRVR